MFKSPSNQEKAHNTSNELSFPTYQAYCCLGCGEKKRILSNTTGGTMRTFCYCKTVKQYLKN